MSKEPKVFIVGGGHSYSQLFVRHGFVLASTPEDADLLCFTGGEDVTPGLYGQGVHETTHHNSYRDRQEASIFDQFKDKPKVGICRGGQLLNVLSGGSMWQHVDNHCRQHFIYHPDGVELICLATSTHHQMMISGKGSEVLAIANESTRREGYQTLATGLQDDTEVVYYDDTKSLCFQPHPEMNMMDWVFHPLRAYFFGLIKDKLGVYHE